MASIVSNAGEPKRELSGSNPTLARGSWSGSGDDANWWMITLSDLTLLLLGFLVVWYAIETKKKTPSQTPQLAQRQTVGPAAVHSGAGTHNHAEEWSALADEIENSIRQAGIADRASVERRQTEVIVSLADAVPFASGKAELTPETRPVVEKLASLVLTHPLLSVQIAGHTDNLPVANGIFPSNWELSAARASRVARYFIAKGVDPAHVAVEGYADERPKAPNSDDRNRAANRRVEIRLYYAQADGRLPPISPGDGD